MRDECRKFNTYSFFADLKKASWGENFQMN